MILNGDEFQELLALLQPFTINLQMMNAIINSGVDPLILSRHSVAGLEVVFSPHALQLLSTLVPEILQFDHEEIEQPANIGLDVDSFARLYGNLATFQELVNQQHQ